MVHSQTILIFPLLLVLLQWPPLVCAQTCSDTVECTSGCCNTNGFCGFGPAYCGDGNCTSTCDAVAECGEYAPSDSYDCPLNVCCSQYGFCGTTSDFCGDGCQTGCETVDEPSCSGTSSDQRVIGYYESWSYDRTCDSWTPEDISAGLWTHLNYAFALIGSDYTISQMNSFDAELYSRFTNLKQSNGALEVYISVGGWDAGGAIFSDMVSTAENRATFISSAIQFMKTYGFDGIDIDWEYPAAEDRDGVAADTENYVTFLKELKEACGSLYGITATLPSSYWYMQGFDVVSMEPYVDWFNFMSYDIHGTWDGNSPYTEAVVQPHTNLTEITQGLDLLWRNGISPSKVVLGLAFYGRSFTLSDTSCTTPGCPFSGGGDPGACTQTSGILSDAEIQDIISEYNPTLVLNEEAGIKYMVWNENQWVSYDDAETFELKRTYANNKCLGGRMVWALDLDDPDDEASLLNLNSAGLTSMGDDVSSNPSYALSKLAATSTQNSVNLISFWTDCEQVPSCPAGFTLLTTGHGKVYDAEKASYTAQGCHGGGNGYNRALCVESDVQVSGCQWYGKPKGCKQTCPAGTFLLTSNTHIGGAKTGCKSGHFSSYCCESITSRQIESCASTNLNNMVTGGLGSTIEDVTAVSKYKDSSYLETDFECLAATVGYFALIRTASYVLNSLPGYWTRVSGSAKYVFNPLSNLVYKNKNDDDGCSHTVTVTSYVTYVSNTPVVKTCDGNKYTQACRHYSSVIDVNQGIDTIICPVHPIPTNSPRPITSVWNSQHNSKWLLWIPKIPKGVNKCNRDEYPPFAFMEADDSNYQQWIRFLPESENKGAGQLWKGVCKDAKSRTKIEGGARNGNTCTSIKSIEYTVNAFSMTFTNIPAGDWLLESNPCLPTITDDSGFALLTNDQWYDGNANTHHNKAAYATTPALSLTQGLTAPRNKPAKRWLDEEEEILSRLADRPASQYVPIQKLEFKPERIGVDEGNSSRHATPEELWEHFGLVKCRSKNCVDEKKAAGWELKELERQKLEQLTTLYHTTVPATAGSSSTAFIPQKTGHVVS